MKEAVQFKISKHLLRAIDLQAGRGNRSYWIGEALLSYLGCERCRRRMMLDATELMSERITILVRIDSVLRDELDDFCSERGHSRTITILDACISQLARCGGLHGLENVYQKSAGEPPYTSLR